LKERAKEDINCDENLKRNAGAGREKDVLL
jgi:hypothetical protein